MPEFIADTQGTVLGQSYEDLSPFLQGYIEAMLFTNVAGGISMVEWNEPENVEAVREGRADGSIPGDSGFGDIYPDSLMRMHLDCGQFMTKARHLLSQVYSATYDKQAAGRDFWYTRNGHGVGFWDRDLPGDIGDKLSDIAREFGEVNASFGEAAGGEESPTGYGFVFVE